MKPAVLGTYVNAEQTVLVTVWDNGVVELAKREHRDAVWGPPMKLLAEAPE